MLTGLAGHLISGNFLELHLGSIPPNVDLSRRLGNLRRSRERQRLLGPASSLRSMLEAGAEPLVLALGFRFVDAAEIGADVATATIHGDRSSSTLLVARWGERLDPLFRLALTESARRRTSWCLLFNGTHLRLVQAARVFSRRFLEFDLDAAFDDDRVEAALGHLVAPEALAIAVPGSPCHLDRMVEASERETSSVCESLRRGVLEASTHVLRALLTRSEARPLDEAFEQALTIVYRVLFLLFAEARELVPLWHPVYRESYSVERLCDEAVGKRAAGLWDALRAVTRLAHAGCRAGDLCVTPFNGRLFAPSRTPLADRRDLDDEAARRSLVALSSRTAPDREGRVPISYRDLGVGQLGAVYETLLDHTPRVERIRNRTSRRTEVQVSLAPGGGVRKATGTFYTPESIARFLIKRTLGPLVKERAPEAILDLRVLDPAMGSGAFLVGACNYLADAYETALVECGRCLPSDLGPRERAAIRRTVAERCLFGVDLNPMAVQLARLSLWLSTLAEDRPLSFLDHHLLIGDSLLGTWLRCLRRPPTTRSSQPLPLFDAADIGDAMRFALPVRFSLALGASDTADQVRDKERALAALADRGSALSKWKQVADVWCARWFANELPPTLFRALSDEILIGQAELPRATTEPLLATAAHLGGTLRFFHWELEFPEAFFDQTGQALASGGFDAVIGNPPWDMVRADAGSSADRATAHAVSSAIVRFTRDSGVYEAQSEGHANRYQLFLERAVALTRTGGRLGLVLPSGVASDSGSARLRRLLFSRCDVDGLVGLDNTRGIFPIHRSVRFMLLSATAGTPTTRVPCRFGVADPAILDRGEDHNASPSFFAAAPTVSLLQRLSGDELSIPHFQSAVDLTIAERAASLFPPLGAESGWNAHFGRELNVTEDRAILDSPGRGLPVIEGKHIDPFRIRVADVRFGVSPKEASRRLGARHLRRRLAYRDVASSTNRLTLIAALLPPQSVSTHTVFCLKNALPLSSQHFLCGLFNSFVLNYLVRLRVTTHVTTGVVERLPVPSAHQAHIFFREIGLLARLLARRPSSLDFAHLNAYVALLYQLSAFEFAHVLETFPLVAGDERAAARGAFTRLERGEIG